MTPDPISLVISTLVGVAALAGAIVGVVQVWLGRSRHSISVELDGDRLEITGLSKAEKQRVLEQLERVLAERRDQAADRSTEESETYTGSGTGSDTDDHAGGESN